MSYRYIVLLLFFVLSQDAFSQKIKLLQKADIGKDVIDTLYLVLSKCNKDVLKDQFRDADYSAITNYLKGYYYSKRSWAWHINSDKPNTIDISKEKNTKAILKAIIEAIPKQYINDEKTIRCFSTKLDEIFTPLKAKVSPPLPAPPVEPVKIVQKTEAEIEYENNLNWWDSLDVGIKQVLTDTFLKGKEKPEKGDFDTIFKIKELDISRKGIKSLEGLKKLSQLEIMRCNDNKSIESLNPILGLTELQEIYADSCAIKGDINLSKLTKLVRLNLKNNNGEGMIIGSDDTGKYNTSDHIVRIYLSKKSKIIKKRKYTNIDIKIPE